MIGVKALGGGVLLTLVAAVIFKDKFFVVLGIGLLILLIIFLIRMFADLYWYGKDKGW